jgi:transposase-like protein
VPTPPLRPERAEEILKAAAECREEGGASVADLARHLGITRNTLASRIRSLSVRYPHYADLPDRVDALLSVPQPASEEPADVTTPEGRGAANRDLLIKDLKKRNRRLEARLLDQENLVERIVAASTQPLPRPRFKVRARKANKRPERDVLLPIFDCQFGSRVVSRDTVNDLGNFDASVFRERLTLYVEKVTKTMADYASGHDLKNIVFALGGDMVEGDEIYNGMEWHIEMHPADQLIGIRDLLAYAIEAVMEAGAELGVTGASVLCVPGNHGRIGGKKSGDRPPSYSWDVTAFRLLEERLANHPIKTFAVEEAGACYFDVRGNLFGMIHGDEIRGWGGIPFYGITRHDAKMIRTANVIPDYVLVGHHHQPASIPTGYGEWLMSGNWVGATTLSKHVGSNTPSQWCYFVSEEHGVCDRSLIYLDEKRKPVAKIWQTA